MWESFPRGQKHEQWFARHSRVYKEKPPIYPDWKAQSVWPCRVRPVNSRERTGAGACGSIEVGWAQRQDGIGWWKWGRGRLGVVKKKPESKECIFPLFGGQEASYQVLPSASFEGLEQSIMEAMVIFFLIVIKYT